MSSATETAVTRTEGQHLQARNDQGAINRRPCRQSLPRPPRAVQQVTQVPIGKATIGILSVAHGAADNPDCCPELDVWSKGPFVMPRESAHIPKELQEKARESDACTILRYRHRGHRGCAGTTRTDGCSRMRSWPAPARWIKQQKVRRPVPGPGQAPATLDLTSRSESSHRSAASFLIHLGAGPNSPNPNATPWWIVVDAGDGRARWARWVGHRDVGSMRKAFVRDRRRAADRRGFPGTKRLLSFTDAR